MDSPEFSEKEAYVEANKGRLTTLLESGEQLSAFVRPMSTVRLGGDKKLTLTGGDREETSEDSDGFSNDEHVAIAIAKTNLLGALTRSRIYQIKEHTEEELIEMGKQSAEFDIDDLDEAVFNTFTFGDVSGTTYELNWVKISGSGYAEKPVHAKEVSIKKIDDLLEETIKVGETDDKFYVDRNVQPVADELVGRLVEVSRLSNGYRDFFASALLALVGDIKAIEELKHTATESDDGNVQTLISEVLERGEKVKLGRELRIDTNLPSSKELNDAIELMGKMREAAE